MLYRVSQRSLFRNINTNLGKLTWNMAELTNQLSTGKKVNKPSDDPSGGSTILAMRTVLADVEQYYKDVSVADDWLKQTESVLQNMKLTVERAYVLAEQMATDTYRDENMEVAADEIELLFDSLIKMGNTRIGNRYLFSGHKTEIKPFVSELGIHDAAADKGNSTVYTGEMVTQGDREFNVRPDVARQTQIFLFEVTSPGGVYQSSGYSTARLSLDPPGDHNALIFEADAAGGWAGSAGNTLSVQYVVSASAAAPSVSVTGSAITVFLATSGTTVTTTARDVMDLLNTAAVTSGMVTVRLAEGNSGNGALAGVSTVSLANGYDGAAMFRVSQDGGLTWSVQDAFTARDFKGDDLYYNPQLGHSNLTTNFRGYGNDLYFVADQAGSWADNLHVQFVTDQPDGTPMSVDFDPPGTSANFSNNWVITVHLETAGGNVVTTANQIMNAINAHASASTVVTASLADYREGGDGVVGAMSLKALSGGDNDYTELGHASYLTNFAANSAGVNPNIRFTALNHGIPGNDLRVEYVLGSAGVSTYVDVPPTSAGVVTVRLETDASGRSVARAQEVVDAVMAAYIADPAGAMVMASLSDPDSHGVGVIEGPLTRTYLTGGDPVLHEENHGVNVRFLNDGSPLMAGDRFEVEVSYFQGDSQNQNTNVNVSNRVKMNVTGDEALGEAMAFDNILDTMARLAHALRNHDGEGVQEELPNLRGALEKLTTKTAQTGVRLIRNQFTLNVLDSTKENSTERMSRFEDVDFEEAITSLQTAQTAYQATLASTAMVTRLSLVDYIS